MKYRHKEQIAVNRHKISAKRNIQTNRADKLNHECILNNFLDQTRYVRQAALREDIAHHHRILETEIPALENITNSTVIVITPKTPICTASSETTAR